MDVIASGRPISITYAVYYHNKSTKIIRWWLQIENSIIITYHKDGQPDTKTTYEWPPGAYEFCEGKPYPTLVA